MNSVNKTTPQNSWGVINVEELQQDNCLFARIELETVNYEEPIQLKRICEEFVEYSKQKNATYDGIKFYFIKVERKQPYTYAELNFGHGGIWNNCNKDIPLFVSVHDYIKPSPTKVSKHKISGKAGCGIIFIILIIIGALFLASLSIKKKAATEPNNTNGSYNSLPTVDSKGYKVLRLTPYNIKDNHYFALEILTDSRLSKKNLIDLAKQKLNNLTKKQKVQGIKFIFYIAPNGAKTEYSTLEWGRGGHWNTRGLNLPFGYRFINKD